MGLEVRTDGSRNLLIFDPMFKASVGIRQLIGTQFRASAPEKLLKAYRFGDERLRWFKTFEILK